MALKAEDLNACFYEGLSPFYDDLYADIDAEEAVRQWRLLFNVQLGCTFASARTGRPRLLDVGCGTGRYLEAWASAGFDVVGIDISKGMLERARSRVRGSPFGSCIRLVEGDLRRPSGALTGYQPFSLAVAHFNFLNLFSISDCSSVLSVLGSVMETDGLFISDCAPPEMMPQASEEHLLLRDVPVAVRTIPEPRTSSVLMEYTIDGKTCVERYHLHSEHALSVVALKSGCTLLKTYRWCPYDVNDPWASNLHSECHRVCVFRFPGASVATTDPRPPSNP